MGDWLRRRLGLVIAVVAIVVFLSATRIATFFTELWWFEAVGYRSLFTGILLTQIGLGVVAGLLLALIVGVNLVIARRLRPVILPASPREAAIERYRQMADPYIPWLIAGVSLLFAISAGGAVAAQWDLFLLWRNGGVFGIEDPQFGIDVGFYVFDLPWLSFVQGWLFTSLLLALLVTAAAHYLLGSIRLELPRDRVTPAAKAHLSVLLALVLGARAWGYWLDRFMLNFSPRGQVTGASYTDVNAELPALNLLLLVSAVAIVLTLVNISRRGWLLPGAAIGLLVLASIILQGIYPAAIQRLQVDPQELAREREFIGRNLEATRTAWGLEEVDSTRFTVDNDLAEEDLEENRVTLENIRLWDPAVLETTYKQLQALRPFYDFEDVDVDRYEIDGEVRQVMLSIRELLPTGLTPQAQTWQNLHLTYTHGFGAVSSRVNTASAEGQPVFLARDIPPRGPAETLIPDEPGVYYGEIHGDYSIVRTDQPELDFEDSETGEQQVTTYAGAGGVPIGSLGRRLAFALRFADPNVLLTGLINDESRVMFHRLVRDRVGHVAPFLSLDQDPYPVVIDRKILWVVDGYTTSAFYPYSEREEFPRLSGRTANYARNSVKAVVDAYDGTVTLYVVDPDDPVVQAWQSAFPGPFASVEEAPEGLQEHFRYPQDLFEIQSRVYTTYHIPAADAFYSKADAWEIPDDASAVANETVQPGTEMQPYYLLMRLPGEETEEFVLIQPYLALNKPNMIAWLAGRSDPGVHGELSAVQFPSDQAILGPTQAQARIEQDPEIAQYITLRDQRGSTVIRGNLIVIPIERSVLYVEPLFLENEQAQIPELAQVVLVLGDDVVMADSLEEGMAELVGAAAPEGEEPGEEPGETEVGATVDELILQALERFVAADAALREGDLSAYQEAIAEAQRLLERAAQERDLEPQPSPAPSPGASPGAAGSPAPEASPTPAG